jgi:putative peptide zinc metalloprotease protein
MSASLARLRDDLQLLEAPAAPGGAPQWSLYDPARGRYFRLGADAFALLNAWHLREPARVLEAANRDTLQPLDSDTLDQFKRFLDANDLVAVEDAQARAALAAKRKAQQHGALTWLLHHYLFFRIPLVRPDAWLGRLSGAVGFLFVPATWVGVGALFLVGLLFALRQWDQFWATFPTYFSLEGALWFGGALGLAKILHELGHAFAAKRYGCRVGSMGLAFMVMWPTLYTDTSDAWRLVSRRQRAVIAVAGMAVELALGAACLLAWTFLPDGPARSAAFLMATATVAMTLLVNLNPFMRFDGYYILSDSWGIDNLQARAFALARWRLRELLFGFRDAPPETLPHGTARAMLLWAYGTWIYRFFLFLGIALLVYHLFFKLLGIFLMVVELWWFIAKPVAAEIADWWRRRGRVRFGLNVVATCLLSGGVLAALFVPWQARVAAPALIEAERQTELFSVLAGRIAALALDDGRMVAAGETLLVLEAPELAFQRRSVAFEIEALRLQLQRQSGNAATLQEIGVLQEKLAERLTVRDALDQQQARLTLTAPFDGVLRDVNPELHVGRWIGADMAVARLVAPDGMRALAFVDGAALTRVAPGAFARFFPDDPVAPPILLRVRDIDPTGVRHLDRPSLGSMQGGPIAVRADERQRLVPVQAIFRTVMAPPAPTAAPAHTQRGTVHIDAEAQSYAARAWRHAVGVFLKESGF